MPADTNAAIAPSMPRAGGASGGVVRRPTGWPTRAIAACSAGEAAVLLASMRRTASLVAGADETKAARDSALPTSCCATCPTRMRIHQGGRSAGCR